MLYSTLSPAFQRYLIAFPLGESPRGKNPFDVRAKYVPKYMIRILKFQRPENFLPTVRLCFVTSYLIFSEQRRIMRCEKKCIYSPACREYVCPSKAQSRQHASTSNWGLWKLLFNSSGITSTSSRSFWGWHAPTTAAAAHPWCS